MIRRHRGGVTDHGSPPSKSRALLGPALLLTLLTLAAYANSLGNEFSWDDQAIIVRNKLITQLRTVPDLFVKDYWAGDRDPHERTPPPTTGLYRPLVQATYALNYAVDDLHPFGYHLVNLLLHLMATGLLYGLARRMEYSPAASTAAAALFAVHPLHVEAVTAVVGRAELLMACAVLAGLLLDGSGRRALALAAFAAGLLAKEQAAVLPALIALYDSTVGPAAPPSQSRPLLRSIRRYAPSLMLLAGYLLLRAQALGGLHSPPFGFLENPAAFSEWPVRLLTFVKVAGLYLQLCVWPAALAVDYSYNAIPLATSPFDGGVLWGVLAWGSLLALGIRNRRRDRRVSFAVGMTVLTFLPVSNLLIPIGTIMGERLFYLPSAGLCLLAACAYERLAPLLKSRRLGTAALAGVVLLLALLTGRTMLRNRDWHDSESLFRSAVRVVPQNAKAYLWLGHSLKNRGAFDEARSAFETAMRIYPSFPESNSTFDSNFGDLLLTLGLVRDATPFFEQAVRLDPRWSATHYHLGLAYARQQQYERAEQHWLEALALNPGLTVARGNRGWALEGLGRLEDAQVEYERVLAVNPGFVDLQQRLAAIRAKRPAGHGCRPGLKDCR